MLIDNIAELLACPLCHKKLHLLKDRAMCDPCGIVFQKDGQVFSFINRQMFESDDEYKKSLKIIEFWGEGWKRRLQDTEHRDLFTLDKSGLLKRAEENIAFHEKYGFLMGKELNMDAMKGQVGLNI